MSDDGIDVPDRDLAPYPTWIEDDAQIFEGRVWLRGTGSIPADVLVVGDKPGYRDRTIKQMFSSPQGKFLNERLMAAGFDFDRAYFTNVVKYGMKPTESIAARDVKACRDFLNEEIRRVNPKLIVCMGSKALMGVMPKGGPGISQIRGDMYPHPTLENVMLYGTFTAGQVMRTPELLGAFDKDLKTISQIQAGAHDRPAPFESELLQTAAQVKAFVARMLLDPNPLLVIDLEWEGKTWMDPNKYIRTAQIGYDHQKAAIVEFRFENGEACMDNEPAAWAALKRLFEDPRVSLVGHNVIADGEWLLTYGIDIRPRVVWDTMLAEFVLNECGPFGLEEISLKYTSYGRYDIPVAMWVKSHKEECKHGYGAVPRDLLLPYGGIDVDVPRTAMEKQFPLVAERFMERRGVNKEYPSLWETTLQTQRLIYELERTGLLVDQERLKKMITEYQGVRGQLLGMLTTETATMGVPDFNPGSPAQVSQLLFQKLKLTPVKSTQNRAWSEQAGNQGMDDGTEFIPSTDKDTLEILEDEHPTVKHILQFRRIDQACKTWLRFPGEDDDESTKSGGLLAKIWPDGRLHAHFSQLAETGRFRHSKPNVANWPKKAEGYLVEIFGGKDKVPHGLRTVIVPPEGHVILEADFCQAELFVLAGLSGDQNMMTALTTPGKDLHDLTAVNSFKLRVIDKEGRDVPEEYMLALAKKDKKEFEAFQKALRYINQQGKTLSRSEFKDTIRVAAKSVNFGYGPKR